MDAAIWGAELALGEGPGRIYIVEPTGPIMNDPNLTDKKYPGNPTKSYRSREPLRVAGEVTDWQGHSPEALKAMKDHIERLRQLGVEAIDDFYALFFLGSAVFCVLALLALTACEFLSGAEVKKFCTRIAVQQFQRVRPCGN